MDSGGLGWVGLDWVELGSQEPSTFSSGFTGAKDRFSEFSGAKDRFSVFTRAKNPFLVHRDQDPKSTESRWKIYLRSIDNLWKVYGNENLSNIYRNLIENQ